MASNRNSRLVDRAIKGQIPAPFSKDTKKNMKLAENKKRNVGSSALPSSDDTDKNDTQNMTSTRLEPQTQIPVSTDIEQKDVGTSLTSPKYMKKLCNKETKENIKPAYNKVTNESLSASPPLDVVEKFTQNIVPACVEPQTQIPVSTAFEPKELVNISLTSPKPVNKPSLKLCLPTNLLKMPSEENEQQKNTDRELITDQFITEEQIKPSNAKSSDTENKLVNISLTPPKPVNKPSLKLCLPISLLKNPSLENEQQKNADRELIIDQFVTEEQKTTSGAKSVDTKIKTVCEGYKKESLSLFAPSITINADEESHVQSLKSLCLIVVLERMGTDSNFTNYVGSEQGLSEEDDFSGTDDCDDYVPERTKKRTRLLSSSSSSSSSSSGSSSSTSSSSSSDSSSSSSSDSSTASLPKGKKRRRNVAQWKKNKVKILRNSGKQYVSRTGKNVEAKEMKPPCSNKCRLSCATKLTNCERKKVFDNYWSLSSLQRQRDYLSSCVNILQISVRRVKTNPTKDRRPNSSFSFLLKGKTIRVCKTFLINTLAISERTLRTFIQAKSSGSGIVPSDGRGKHSKRKQDPEVVNSVREHINSIPRIESHYVRANTSREFIDGGLTIAELYRYYKEQRESLNKVAAKYEYYAYIFNTEFNISFFAPKKDQCDVCEAYKNAIDQEKQRLEEEFKEHQKQKELSRKEKARDIKACNDTNRSNIVAIYDLQAVMPVPLGESSAFFYKSKLNCYNFTVTDMKNKTTTCYFWHEGLGNRGATEIGTCVFKFLEQIAQTNPNCDMIFYSDNCCGQQKNRFILAMYYYAVTTLEINSVTHKFLIRGHTQNEGDNAHSLIEKSIKRAKKSGPIYVPSQYVQIIRSSKKTGKAFNVVELNHDDFIDLKILADEIGMNSTKDNDGKTIKLTEIRMIRFFKNSDTYEYKTTYNEDEDWTKVPIKIRSGTGRKSRKNEVDIENITVKPAYSSKLTITERKKKDLSQLIKDNIVPKQYTYFYNSIF